MRGPVTDDSLEASVDLGEQPTKAVGSYGYLDGEIGVGEHGQFWQVRPLHIGVGPALVTVSATRSRLMYHEYHFPVRCCQVGEDGPQTGRVVG